MELLYVGSVPRTDRLGNGPYIYNEESPTEMKKVLLIFCSSFSKSPIGTLGTLFITVWRCVLGKAISNVGLCR